MVQDNDEIIELTDEVDTPDKEDQGIIELTQVVPADDLERQVPGFEAPLVLENAGNTQGCDTAIPQPQVGREEFEAALERVIEKKFSNTIEKILFEVMETVIQKEITDIKTSLQKDLDDIGRP